MVNGEYALCGAYSIGVGSDCVLFGFPKDVTVKEKWCVATNLNMSKDGFLCQQHLRASDIVVKKKRSRLLRGSVPLDVASEEVSLRMAGVLSVEQNEVRMLHLKIRTEKKVSNNRTEYLGRKVRKLQEVKKSTDKILGE